MPQRLTGLVCFAIRHGDGSFASGLAARRCAKSLPRGILPKVPKENFNQAFYGKHAILIFKKVRQWFDKRLKNMVIPTGIEPVTYRLGICRSILLSYGTTRAHS